MRCRMGRKSKLKNRKRRKKRKGIRRERIRRMRTPPPTRIKRTAAVRKKSKKVAQRQNPRRKRSSLAWIPGHRHREANSWLSREEILGFTGCLDRSFF